MKLFKLPRTHRNAGQVLRCEPERSFIKRGDADARVCVGDDGVHGVGRARGDEGDGERDVSDANASVEITPEDADDETPGDQVNLAVGETWPWGRG